MQEPRRIYLAGPYTNGDTARNVAEAIEIADIIRGMCGGNLIPFVPHLFHFWHMIRPRDYEDWMALDLHWLGLCHALIRLPGDSPGADLEIEKAQELGIPVLTSPQQLEDWYYTTTQETSP